MPLAAAIVAFLPCADSVGRPGRHRAGGWAEAAAALGGLVYVLIAVPAVTYGAPPRP